MELSKKGQELLVLYESMAADGYIRSDQTHIENAFSDFESRIFRHQLKSLLADFKVTSILDYGCGGSDWDMKGFDETGLSAREFYKLNECWRYEPARDLDERRNVDCVICFDVLEHIFIADLEMVINDIFCNASKLVILNIACYEAAALLPNGENAHITVRPSHYWKALVDQVALRYPNVSVLLLTSEAWRKTAGFPIYKANDWLTSEKFVTNT
jgi:hypothetical protein